MTMTMTSRGGREEEGREPGERLWYKNASNRHILDAFSADESRRQKKSPSSDGNCICVCKKQQATRRCVNYDRHNTKTPGDFGFFALFLSPLGWLGLSEDGRRKTLFHSLKIGREISTNFSAALRLCPLFADLENFFFSFSPPIFRARIKRRKTEPRAEVKNPQRVFSTSCRRETKKEKKSLKRLRQSRANRWDEGYIKCLKSEVKERKKKEQKKAVQARENFCRSSEKRRKKKEKKTCCLIPLHTQDCFGVVQ